MILARDKRHTDIEEVDWYQHGEVDESEDDEDPEPDGGYQIWNYFIDDTTRN